MKTVLLIVIATLAPTGCALYADPSGTSLHATDTSGAEVRSTPLIQVLNCVETRTFIDVPGIESLISIDRAANTASVKRRSVAMVGFGEWRQDAHVYSVTRQSGDDFESLVIEEEVETVDWSTTESCYALRQQNTYKLTWSETWSGQSVLILSTLLDPAHPECDHPELSRPMPLTLDCKQL